jgi:hypothetical protein
LRERCHGNIDDLEIEYRLDHNKLSQICVKLTSTGLLERSQNMARQMGFKLKVAAVSNHEVETDGGRVA